jgi:hypothetical protein
VRALKRQRRLLVLFSVREAISSLMLNMNKDYNHMIPIQGSNRRLHRRRRNGRVVVVGGPRRLRRRRGIRKRRSARGDKESMQQSRYGRERRSARENLVIQEILR